MLRKLAPFALLVIGSLVMLVAFLFFAGNAIPYQDPTAELLSHQAAEARNWSLLFAIGLAATVSGAVWLWRRWRAKQHRTDAR